MVWFDSDRIAAARDQLDGRVIRTPVLPLCSSRIAPYIPDGAELHMKLELFQHTGSFKARGSLLGIDWLSDEARRNGIVGFSGGNFALAAAWAAKAGGVHAKMVMPEAADPFRIEGCRGAGAEVVLLPAMLAALPLLEAISRAEARPVLHPSTTPTWPMARQAAAPR